MKIYPKGQTCHLLASKAIFWQEQKTIILADVHVGKDNVFRQAGIPIPEGSMEADLSNISCIVKETQAQTCIIVGDLIHATSGFSTRVKQIFGDWLHSLPCDVHLVMGNHDRGLTKHVSKEWPLHVHQESLLMDPFYFSHHPVYQEPWFVWAGHIHPKVELKNRYDRLTLRCFQIYPSLGILPAFSCFTGGTLIKKEPHCSIFAIAGSSIIPL